MLYGVLPGTMQSFPSKNVLAKSGPLTHDLLTSGSHEKPPLFSQEALADATRPGKTMVLNEQLLLCPRQFLQPP